jgi:hypothetical protein
LVEAEGVEESGIRKALEAAKLEKLASEAK